MIKQMTTRKITNVLVGTVFAVALAGGMPASAEAAPAAKVTGQVEAGAFAMSTFSQQQAVAAAKNYLRTMAFSRAGLIRQLSSHYGSGFSKADATYAVNHIQVNWNTQAVKAAKNYLRTMAFSRAGLIRQLESPYGSGFTHAQAVYGVNHTGL
jgi:hypothetical protein